MPRYFFNIVDGVSKPDTVGTEFPDIDRARIEAISFAGQLLRELGMNNWSGNEWRLDVTGANGDVLFILKFSVESGERGTLPGG